MIETISPACFLESLSLCQGIRPIVTSFRPELETFNDVVDPKEDAIDGSRMDLCRFPVLTDLMDSSVGVMKDETSPAKDVINTTTVGISHRSCIF